MTWYGKVYMNVKKCSMIWSDIVKLSLQYSVQWIHICLWMFDLLLCNRFFLNCFPEKIYCTICSGMTEHFVAVNANSLQSNLHSLLVCWRFYWTTTVLVHTKEFTMQDRQLKTQQITACLICLQSTSRLLSSSHKKASFLIKQL